MEYKHLFDQFNEIMGTHTQAVVDLADIQIRVGKIDMTLRKQSIQIERFKRDLDILLSRT